jgi:hypothetical protein
MEKRINKRVEQYIIQFKDDIRNKINELDIDEKSINIDEKSINIDEKSKISQLIEYVYEYEKLVFTKDDFVKRKRLKNTIPNMNRCSAKLANNEQCTRRRKPDCEYCGTHYKGLPNGLMDPNDTNESSNKKTIDIYTEDIRGIIYYLDKYNNVYKVTDILEGVENPQIIAKYSKNGSEYTIYDI